MAIGAVSARHVDVEGRKTAVSPADIRGAIARAYEHQTGKKPTAQLLDTLTAQASLETGSGAAMYNYNFGGIKGGAPGTNETARLRTKEVIGGKEVEIRDGFRAYRSLDAGADDYVHLLRTRFGDAVHQAELGSVSGFAHALKEAHYYTADESKYASALNALSGKADAPTRAVATSSPANVDLGASSSDAFPTTAELGRVLDAIGRHRPLAEDDEDD